MDHALCVNVNVPVENIEETRRIEIELRRELLGKMTRLVLDGVQARLPSRISIWCKSEFQRIRTRIQALIQSDESFREHSRLTACTMNQFRGIPELPSMTSGLTHGACGLDRENT